MDRLHHLNPAQREAVLTLSGPLLVLAGAGTGKTRVITYRMAELIRRGTTPPRILSVTFTNKAAREMQERTAGLLGRRFKSGTRGPGRQAGPVISTFHSYCVRVLRQEITRLGYPASFAIYDRGEQESVARTALRDVRVGDDTLRPADLLARISRWKMAGVLPGQAADHVEDDRDQLAAVAYRKYQASLRAAGAVDFDDLLLLTGQVFEEFPQALQRQQARFDHVQIDEYQDTNAAQFALVDSLVRQHRNLCVVGDDDQSIYGWRGAEVEHILNFEAHFPGARVVRLEDNYRSTDRILELANRLVRHNRGRHEKSLVAHKRAARGVRIVEFEDEVKEAECVVREIRELIGRGVNPDDIAILFRTNEQPRVFETELRRAGVRYVLVGGQSFFDRREVRDLLAYLKVLAYPADEVSLLRIINTPARGIGASSVEKLLKRAVQSGRGLWDVIPDAARENAVPAAALNALAAFHELLERYRVRFHESPSTMDQSLVALVGEINYRGEIEKQYKQPEQQLVRWAMVEQFVDSVKQHIERAREPSLASFLEEAALVGRDEEFGSDGEGEQHGVRLMTLHSAKGLEFPRVYLVGLEEGLLPHHRSLIGPETAIEEERRLAYVGVTRAMDELTLTRAASRLKWGKRKPSIPSRFLREMVAEELTELQAPTANSR
ncbi:MAG TPA: UvrD-helicase domain-containing protein [Planctomycetaceae bacterium]|nr:UvrD-helicase domain-containing protein [Planctomycetaceae bacterium]